MVELLHAGWQDLATRNLVLSCTRASIAPASLAHKLYLFHSAVNPPEEQIERQPIASVSALGRKAHQQASSWPPPSAPTSWSRKQTWPRRPPSARRARRGSANAPDHSEANRTHRAQPLLQIPQVFTPLRQRLLSLRNDAHGRVGLALHRLRARRRGARSGRGSPSGRGGRGRWCGSGSALTRLGGRSLGSSD